MTVSINFERRGWNLSAPSLWTRFGSVPSYPIMGLDSTDGFVISVNDAAEPIDFDTGELNADHFNFEKLRDRPGSPLCLKLKDTTLPMAVFLEARQMQNGTILVWGAAYHFAAPSFWNRIRVWGWHIWRPDPKAGGPAPTAKFSGVLLR